ncbi:MAG: hypothetical protein HDT43_02595 [Ruminococcaceae bacterium]|nr:hypothetical protein [Oscillospiraceae bacterium]
MNLKSREEKRAVIDYAIKTLRGCNESRNKNLQNKGIDEEWIVDEEVAEKDIKKFLDNIIDIKVFSFFPFDIMSIEMVSEFIVSNILRRKNTYGKIFKEEGVKNGDNSCEVKDKAESEGIQIELLGTRQIMDNLKKEKYYLLRNDGEIDSFIVGDIGQLNETFKTKHPGNVPDYWCDEIRNHLCIYLKNTKIFSDNLVQDNPVCSNIIAEVKEVFGYFFTPLLENVRSTQKPIIFQDLFYHLQAHSSAIDYVDEMIKHTVYLCVVINTRIRNEEKEDALHRLKEWARTLRNQYSTQIITCRNKNIQNYRKDISTLSLSNLSLQFAFHLHKIAENGFRQKVVERLSKNNSESEMTKINEYSESDLLDKEKYATYLSENQNRTASEQQIEVTTWLAKQFYDGKKEFISEDPTFLYMTKPFFRGLFTPKTSPTNKAMKKIHSEMEGDTANIDDIVGFYLELDRQHHRHLETLGLYSTFNEVLFEFYKFTEETYRTLNPEDSLAILLDFFITYLEFYTNEKISGIDF